MTRIAPIALLLAAVSAPVAHAAPGDELVATLKALQPALPIESVTETDFEGMLAIELEDGGVLYGTADGRFLFTGDMYSVEGGGFVNLTDSIRAERRRELLAGVSRDDMIVFSPAGERKAYVDIFTDVDCGYCRKLHQEMAEINALGIEVRYLAFPRAGTDSDSYRKTVSAWCSRDPRHAITELKLGRGIPARSCSNPVSAQMELGEKIGVSGTPALVTEDGHLIPGYLPAEELAAALGL
ncbi:MAG: thioredoxin fold domain-containing protein [Gammaproteobacteria bacterium]|nr:thioredoxin fold domain-containing protein [Gammaproteobacteria bacterium]